MINDDEFQKEIKKIKRKSQIKDWQQSNREKVNAYSKAWREKHKEKYREIQRKWRENHKEQAKEMSRKCTGERTVASRAERLIASADWWEQKNQASDYAINLVYDDFEETNCYKKIKEYSDESMEGN